MSTREQIQVWVSDFLDTPASAAWSGLVREYAPEVLTVFLEAACANRGVEPSEIEAVDLKPALLDGVSALELPGSLRPQIPRLCAGFLEALEAAGRLGGGRALGRHVKALGPAWRAVGAPIVRPASKLGRNDPCPCGSGLKYKRCCMRRLDS